MAKFTKEQRLAAAELCQELPVLLDRLQRAGLPKTARKMAEAVREIGWETADLITEARRAKRPSETDHGRRPSA